MNKDELEHRLKHIIYTIGQSYRDLECLAHDLDNEDDIQKILLAIKDISQELVKIDKIALDKPGWLKK